MRSKTYIIKIPPIAWMRVGVSRAANHLKFYDRQANDKLYFGIEAARQHDDEPLFDKPFMLDACFYLQRPRVGKNKKLGYPVHGDTDNYCKFLLDGLQSVIFTNDRLCVVIHAKKLYADGGTEARTEFTITEVE